MKGNVNKTVNVV